MDKDLKLDLDLILAVGLKIKISTALLLCHWQVSLLKSKKIVDSDYLKTSLTIEYRLLYMPYSQGDLSPRQCFQSVTSTPTDTVKTSL